MNGTLSYNDYVKISSYLHRIVQCTDHSPNPSDTQDSCRTLNRHHKPHKRQFFSEIQFSSRIQQPEIKSTSFMVLNVN